MEKRKERRIKVSLPIEVVHGRDWRFLGKTENISRLGTYFKTDKKIPVGAEINIKLEIPLYSEDLSSAGEVRCKGGVFRCNLIEESATGRYYGLGIFFTDFKKESDRNKLSGYIDYLIRGEEDSIEKGAKRWRERRQIHRIRQEESRKSEKKGSPKEVFNLLNQILARLEEIKRLLEAQDKSK